MMASVFGVAKLKEIITAVPSSATALGDRISVANVTSNAIMAGTLMNRRVSRARTGSGSSRHRKHRRQAQPPHQPETLTKMF